MEGTMTKDEGLLEPMTLSPAQGDELVSRAVAQLERESVSCAPAFRGKAANRYRGCKLDGPGGMWAAIRARQDASSAQLIDAAAAYRAQIGAVGVVAILDPPDPLPKRPATPARDYVRRYQSAAWYGLNIVFTYAPAPETALVAWEPADLALRGDFDDIAADFVRALDDDKSGWIPIDGSPEAEGLVRPSLHRVLESRSFKRALGESVAKPNAEDGEADSREGRGKSYQGYWRRPASDGLWVRSAGTPRRVALEVKWHEDVDAPLCQVVDHLAAADAVFGVRLGGKTDYAEAAVSAMDLLQRRLPVRYIEVAWDNPD
jgi:hypothetical protein